MIRWKTKCTYKAGRYPVIALVDLFFILLLLFVLSNSMLYLPGVLFATNAGQVEEAGGMQLASLGPQEDFSHYVIADKMVLTIDDEGGMELNTKPVRLEDLDRELGAEASKLLRMYSNSYNFSHDAKARKAFRPKLVISASPHVPVGVLDDVISKVRNKKMDVVFKTSKSQD